MAFGSGIPRKHQDHLLEVSSMSTDHFYIGISTVHAAHLCTSLLFPQYLLQHFSFLEILNTDGIHKYQEKLQD